MGPTEHGMPQWHLYLVRTARGALYTGITTDVARRVRQHQDGRGAKALRAKGPITLVYTGAIGSRGDALRVEAALKKLPKAAKEALLARQLAGDALRTVFGLPPVPVAALTDALHRKD